MLVNGTGVTVLLEYNKLTVNGRVISDSCTSFAIYDVFLLFTNNSTGMYQRLYVLNLQLNPWVLEDEDPTKKLPADDSKSLSIRNVERGSKIVCCTLGRVVLQLPRGNLETIYPKTIVLALVKGAVYDFNYLRALELCRTHKLDLNLLFDLHPQQFLDRCETALASISKSDYINLFISTLKQGISD
jgi:elongator complex protein 1